MFLGFSEVKCCDQSWLDFCLILGHSPLILFQDVRRLQGQWILVVSCSNWPRASVPCISWIFQSFWCPLLMYVCAVQPCVVRPADRVVSVTEFFRSMQIIWARMKSWRMLMGSGLQSSSNDFGRALYSSKLLEISPCCEGAKMGTHYGPFSQPSKASVSWMMGLRRTMYGLRDGVTSTYSDIDASINTESNEAFTVHKISQKGFKHQGSSEFKVEHRATSWCLFQIIKLFCYT